MFPKKEELRGARMREEESQERVDKCGRDNMKELEKPRKTQR